MPILAFLLWPINFHLFCDKICFQMKKYSVLINKYLWNINGMILWMKSTYWIEDNFGKNLLILISWFEWDFFFVSKYYFGEWLNNRWFTNWSLIPITLQSKAIISNQIPGCMDDTIFCSYRMRNFRENWRSIKIEWS